MRWICAGGEEILVPTATIDRLMFDPNQETRAWSGATKPARKIDNYDAEERGDENGLCNGPHQHLIRPSICSDTSAAFAPGTAHPGAAFPTQFRKRRDLRG